MRSKKCQIAPVNAIIIIIEMTAHIKSARSCLFTPCLLQDMSILRDYLTYAKTFVHPTISEEAGQSLIQAYVEMRQVGSSRGQVSAYPRQLESLIRLAEAHARMRLSEEVDVADVEEARRLEL